MTNQKQKRVYISWFPFSSPSESMANHLKAKSYHIYYFKRHQKILTPLKYMLASFKTHIVLQMERPDIIFVENPPIFAVLIVWLYCLINKSKYIVDTHSGAFTVKRWAVFLNLYRFLAKRALMNVLHNEPIERKMADWKAPTMTLEPAPVESRADRVYPFRRGFNVVLISTYAGDEPVTEAIEAASRLPGVNLYITGNLQQAPKSIVEHHPDNVVLTDFLPQSDYIALLQGCDVVMCLTKNDNTMQWGALEALEFERPIITSDWQILRDFFPKGAVHVDNSTKSIMKAIDQIRKNQSVYLRGIKTLREERRTIWTERFSKLVDLVETA
jgi:glycosyltransferase involved in cell wall biosynthesis